MQQSFVRGALGALVGVFFSFAAPAHAASTPELVRVITGTVTDSAGTPLPNVQVFIPSLGIGTTTNSSGRFTLRPPRPGTYHLSAQIIGYAPGHRDVTVPASGDTVRVSFVLRATALTLSAVQVTATPTASDPQSVAQATAQLSGAALSRNLAPSVAQTLANEPGVAVRYNGPAASAPVIRGLQGDRIVVLQDGERAGDLSSSSSDHTVSIDPLAAQRIEVVRGPASLLYGNNAIGGVVNVISNEIPTSVPTHVEGYIGGQAESVNPGGALSGALTYPIGESLALTVRGGWRNVNDVRQGGNVRLDNTYAKNYYGGGGFGFSRGIANGGLVYNGYRFDYGLPSAPGHEGHAHGDIHIEGHRHQLSGQTSLHLPSTALSLLKLSGTAQWYTHDEIESTGEIGTTFNLRTQTANLTGKTQFGRLTGAVGLSGLFKQYTATGEEALTPAANSNSGGVFVYQEVPLVHTDDEDERVPRLQFGARYDLYRIASKAGEPKFGAPRSLDFNSWSGSIGITTPISGGLSLGLSAARAFRAPTVEELFSDGFHAAAGTYDRGNPNLGTEVSQGVDGVLNLQSGRVNAQLAAYYNRINDYVHVNIVGDTAIDDGAVPLNQFAQDNATMKGIEGRIEAAVTPRIVLGAMGDVVRGTFRNGTPLPFIPAARLGGSARWDNGRLSLGGELRHGFQQDRVPTAASEEDPSAVATGAYTVLDLSVGFTLISGAQLHSIVLRADNITDTRYADATSRLKSFAYQPGRNIGVVYKVVF